jgi:drug/metabolite transporter (DMT)-like permease
LRLGRSPVGPAARLGGDVTLPVGESAALATALLWAVTAIVFAEASARIGAMVVNLLRLVLAFGLLTIFGAIARGHPWPDDASAHAWLWLGISGVIGFTVGDLCLFRSLVLIGPRLASLLMALAPPMTAVIGWIVLGEMLTGRQWLGMSLTLVGIAWALVDRAGGVRELFARGSGHGTGIGLAVLAALGQAIGFVLSKHGMGDYDAFAATQIRTFVGILGFVAIFGVLRLWPRVRVGLRDRKAVTLLAVGSVLGPFLGVSLSLVAVRHTDAGVAASLIAISPLLVIPLVAVLGRERLRAGAVIGGAIAVAGVMMLVS